MTVKELIEKLQEFDPELRVAFSDGEGSSFASDVYETTKLVQSGPIWAPDFERVKVVQITDF